MQFESLLSDPEAAARIKREIEELCGSIKRDFRLMEVCGTHTMALRQHGIHSMLPDSLHLISGPGCPVCVTPTGYIDNALCLVEKHGCTVASFGDMVKVPGSEGTTLSRHLGSKKVRIMYSPADLASLAETVDGPVVFLGIGFETTIPVVLAGFKKALANGRSNVYLYTAFKTVPPALRFLLADRTHEIDGFLLPGHVSVIIGVDSYRFLESGEGIPGVVTGFEPLDMLLGIKMLLKQGVDGTRLVENAYPRAVRRNGNRRAQNLIEELLEPYDAVWRAIGVIDGSGLKLRDEFRKYDAVSAFGLPEESDGHPPGCLCGSVIQGKVIPPDCSLFGNRCTPDRPVGPCMVSSEGTCAAYLRYGS